MGHMASFYLRNSGALSDATELMHRFGKHAECEAAARANSGRSRGNLHSFCHWRQIERAIAALRDEDVTGTVH